MHVKILYFFIKWTLIDSVIRNMVPGIENKIYIMNARKNPWMQTMIEGSISMFFSVCVKCLIEWNNLHEDIYNCWWTKIILEIISSCLQCLKDISLLERLGYLSLSLIERQKEKSIQNQHVLIHLFVTLYVQINYDITNSCL